jgi:hypothetical protein
VISVRDRRGAEQTVNRKSSYCKMEEEDRLLVYGEMVMLGGGGG